MKKYKINYQWLFLLLIFLVAAGLALSYFLPEQIGSWEIRKVDMLSSLRTEDATADSLLYQAYLQQGDKAKKTLVQPDKNLGGAKQGMGGQQTKPSADPNERAEHAGDMPSAPGRHIEYSPDDSLSLIYDYSADGQGLRQILGALGRTDRPVYIAFCGDSFIEGDVFTGAVRQLLQGAYGGSGVGMMPISSEVAGFRNTVKHTFKGWKDISILKNTRRAYMLSGHCFDPTNGAMVQYSLPNKSATFDKSVIFYCAEQETPVQVDGDSVMQTLPSTGGALGSYEVRGGNGIKLTFPKAEGLTLYGVALDNHRGVILDNYSIRGNAGFQLLGMNMPVAQAYARLRPMDLVVLQYGLNVASEKQKDYSNYTHRMSKVIRVIRQLYPQASIMLMGISDRVKRGSDGNLHTMSGVLYLAQAQRELAESEGIVFWDTLKAMGGPGSMIKFAGNGWAAKDYTHLGHAGGRVLAKKFVESLKREKAGGNHE